MNATKTYTVNRSMHGDGRDYEAGDTREMLETDAQELLRSGALSIEGEEPAVREPAVRHTFGKEPSAVNNGGYTSATGDGITMPRQPSAKKAKAAQPDAA